MNIPEKPQFQTDWQYVSRKQAQVWLETVNTNNRARSEAEVRRWVDRYNLNRYQPTHQGIAFDEDGILVDGQTRLEALTNSDIPGIWIQVSTNMPRATFDVIDVGRARSAGHLIPGPFANNKAGAARWMIDYPALSYPSSKTDTSVVLDAYDAHRDSIDLAVNLTREAYRAVGISHSMHTALIAVVLSAEGEPMRKIDEWVEGVTFGAGLEIGDPRLALRNRWSVDQRHLKSGNGARAGMFFLVRAWNAYVAGESMVKMQLPKGGRANNASIPEVTR